LLLLLILLQRLLLQQQLFASAAARLLLLCCGLLAASGYLHAGVASWCMVLAVQAHHHIALNHAGPAPARAARRQDQAAGCGSISTATRLRLQ
jgi:hypothetical protein